MIEPRADRPGRITLGADKGYDAVDFVNELRSQARGFFLNLLALLVTQRSDTRCCAADP
jgi:hypothetical protein